MKKLLLALSLLATPAAAQSLVMNACYPSGNFAKCWPSGGLYLDSLKSVRFGTNSTTYVELVAPIAVTGSYTLTWPVFHGSTGEVLSDDGSGGLYWGAAGASLADLYAAEVAISSKTAVDLVCVSNVTLANIQTCDGQPTSNAARVLLTAQTDPTEDGVWLVEDVGAWVRPHDFVGISTVPGSLVSVTEGGNGTTYQDTLWYGYGDGGSTAAYKRVPLPTNAAQKIAGFDSLSPMTAAGDLIYGGTSGTGTALAKGSATQVLHSGTTPSYSAVSLTADVTGTLPIGSGGTAATTKAAAFDSLSPMSAAGDVIYGGTAGTGTRLAKGTSTQVLHSGTTPSYAAVSLTADVSGVLPAANGGTAVNSTATFPSSGVVVTEAASETLTNKTLSTGTVMSAGTIDGVVIGGGTPAAGNFTNVTTSKDTAAGGSVISVADTATTPGGSDIGVAINYTNGGTTTTSQYMRFSKAGSTIGSIAQNASTTVAFNTSSDARLKENIVDFPNGLATLRKVRARKFTWKDGGAEDRGVIAQELKEVYPWPVYGDGKHDPKYEPMSVDYGKLTPLLLAALKELDAQVQKLSADFDAYKKAHP